MLDLAGVERGLKHEYVSTTRKWNLTLPNVKIDKEAFAEGAMRSAYHMVDLSVNSDESHYVAKISKDPKTETKQYFDDVIMQSEAKLWAEQFNLKNPPKKVDFLVAFVLELIDRPGRPVCAVERFVHGEYVKHSNNDGWSDERRNTPHAFSHFSFEASNHVLLVCDVQGVGDLFTDPQIHTVDGRGFGCGNTGRRGILRFFETHRCNAICKYLSLVKEK